MLLPTQNRFDCSSTATRIHHQPPAHINRADQGNRPERSIETRDKRQHEALRSSQPGCAARNFGSAICGLAPALIPSDHASKKSLASPDDRDRGVWRLVEHQSLRTACKPITSAGQQEAVGGQPLLRGVLRLTCSILTHPDPDSLFATASTISPNHYPRIRPTAEVL